ncbi:MAG: hypothetical protein NTW56_18490 [Alphaproteobacteria bacterium]|nr:hypothetical protein [Alphaproteobacteria bacterium]
MPFLHRVSPGGGLPYIYNLEQAVGPNSPNAREDVRLVQVMLRCLYGVRASGLKPDGWIGPTTNTWIRVFQNDMRAQGNNVLLDGRMDRAFNRVSSVSRTIYAIMLLNLRLWETRRDHWAAVPRLVALSNNPRLNPYNPRPIAPEPEPEPEKRWARVQVLNGQFYVYFDDGTVVHYKSKGPFMGQQLWFEGNYTPGPDGKPVYVGRLWFEPEVPIRN